MTTMTTPSRAKSAQTSIRHTHSTVLGFCRRLCPNLAVSAANADIACFIQWKHTYGMGRGKPVQTRSAQTNEQTNERASDTELVAKCITYVRSFCHTRTMHSARMRANIHPQCVFRCCCGHKRNIKHARRVVCDIQQQSILITRTAYCYGVA